MIHISEANNRPSSDKTDIFFENKKEIVKITPREKIQGIK